MTPEEAKRLRAAARERVAQAAQEKATREARAEAARQAYEVSRHNAELARAAWIKETYATWDTMAALDAELAREAQ